MSSTVPKVAIYLVLGSIILFIATVSVVYHFIAKKNANDAVYVAPFYNKLKKLEKPFRKDADRAEYERVMIEYVSMADMANKVFPIDTSSTDRAKALADIKDIGIYYWTRNIEILNGLKEIELPHPLNLRTKLFIEYCQLNKDYYTLIYKAIDEQSKAYDEEIMAYEQKINDKMKKIKES